MDLPELHAIPEKDRVFLRPDEAVAAIREDFAQYEPQRHLLLNLGGLILGPGQAVEDGTRRGVWIREGARRKPRLIEYRVFGDLLCSRLESQKPTLETLSVICRMVFHTRVESGRRGGGPGVWIETGMESFSCTSCGRCCREVGYPREVEVEDVNRWQTAGRTDILQWVGLKREHRGLDAYRIWIDPVTRRPAGVCPWLEKRPGSHLYRCRIHEVKPAVCRLYPGSRKHAAMTGCRGFEPQ